MTAARSLLALAVAALMSTAALAQKSSAPAPAEEDFEGLTFEQTLAVPQVPKKQKSFVANYMRREAEGLDKLGYKVETMRQGEVVIATIPADELFAPNDTLLLPTAHRRLEAFLPYFRTAGMFRVVLAMHSDDTGSESYLHDLTERRIVSLYDYFDEKANDTNELIGYPMADADPALPNNSRKNRRANRRLEIYIIPGPELIAQAGKK